MTDKDFDFIEDGKNEIATSGSPEIQDTRISPEVIQEARKLAGSKKGLEIEPFFTKHNITYNIDRLLHGKLDKDGYLL